MKRTKYQYASLTRELALTEFKLKYQGSLIGYVWSLLKPLALFGVLYLVFTVFVRFGSGVRHYPIYLLLGVVLWNYFAESTNNGMHAIVDKGDLIRKIYFPRLVLLIASSISALITLLLNLIIVVIFMLVAGIGFQWSDLGFILLIVELYLLSLGLSLFLASLYVRFRDLAYIWEVVLQLLFYASAIIYPLSFIPARYIKYIVLSPVSQILQDGRQLLFASDQPTTFTELHHGAQFIPYLIPIVLVVTGLYFFEKSSAQFAEEI